MTEVQTAAAETVIKEAQSGAESEQCVAIDAQLKEAIARLPVRGIAYVAGEGYGYHPAGIPPYVVVQNEEGQKSIGKPCP